MPVFTTDSDVVILIGESQAKIALHGAHVYSWTVENEEQLFLSSASSINGPAAIRGGIPICFPVFGPPPNHEPFNNLKQHGFARTSKWVFDDVNEDTDSVQARFRLPITPEIQNIFPNSLFTCKYVVKISGKTLKTTLEVSNPTEKEFFNFQALLHTYLILPKSLSPEDNVLVGPLKGLSFTDKVKGGKVEIEKRDKLDFKEGEVDRVYDNVSDNIEVQMGDQKLILIKTNSLPNLTVWNPHQAKSDAMVDMEKDGWKRFVCVEPGHTTNFVKLGPKSSWTGEQLLIAETKTTQGTNH